MSRPEIFDASPDFREDLALSKRVDSFRAVFGGLARAITGRVDSFVNTWTGLGGSRDRTVQAQVANFCPLTWPELDAMYHGDDLPAIIVDRLPTDALSMGFSFESPELDEVVKLWRLQDIVLEGRIWARLYGAGGVLIGSDDAPMDSPLHLKNIRPGMLRYLMPVDREDLSIAEHDSDTKSPTFGDALMYRVGYQNVHPSRLVLFRGARTGGRQRARTGGWDLSVLQRPYNVLRDTDQTWRSVMCLLQDLSQAVFAINGLGDMITNGHKNVVLDRMEVTNYARSAARAVVIDAENERYEHVGAANVTGVDPLLIRAFQRLAAAADMPLTLLMGTSPAGLNATGESDLAIWYKKCGGERALLAPGIHYLGAVIARDAGLPIPAGIDWPKLWELNDSEQADVDGKRATAAKTRIEAGITDPDDEARVLAGEDLAVVLRERAELGELEAIDEDDDSIDVSSDQIWVDTATGARLQVKAVGEGRVFFVNLDADNPNAQRAWARRTFLARCHLAPAQDGAQEPDPRSAVAAVPPVEPEA